MNATAPDPQPWYEVQPERVEWELEQFAERGLPADETRGLADGRHPNDLVVRTELPFRGEQVPINVAFPFDYPDEHPTVYGPLGLLERHQQPGDGNFCWAEDHDRDWKPDDCAASLVDEDVRWLLEDTENGRIAVHAGEADMPEPLTGLVPHGTQVVVVADPYFEDDLHATEGRMTLRMVSETAFLAEARGLSDPDAAADEYMRAPGSKEDEGRWLALDPTPSVQEFRDPDTLAGYIERCSDQPFARLKRRLKKKKRLPVAMDWLGLTFMEEGPERGQFRRNWLFFQIGLTRDGARIVGPAARAQALTLTERQRRTPELVGLEATTVLVVGAGSVGGALTMELARAGVGSLDVIDNDIFDVNNSVRHALPPLASGRNKADGVAVIAQENNPFITCHGHTFRIGNGAEEARRLRDLVVTADVVVDTTGSNSVARIVQRHCRDAGVPLVVAGLSAGSYGYEVVTIDGSGSPCLECFLLHQQNDAIPSPDAAPPGPGVTPVGCSHPAFAGAGFDAMELASATARRVVQATGATDYLTSEDAWQVRNFRTEPAFVSGPLTMHPGCSRCAP